MRDINMNNDLKARIVCIMGMHRSGTSCLAGSLEEAGLYLGDVVTAATHNLKGNRENRRIWELNDAVLRHSGGSWSQPPEQVSWSDVHRVERDAIIASFENRPFWGFKDPRTLLVMDFWREAISDFVFVGTFRHPRLVAESLVRREGQSIDYWIELWVHYNTRLLALHEANPFAIIRFDIAQEAYRHSLSMIMERLELKASATIGFFDPTLRHHQVVPVGPLPDKVSRLYQSLCRIALDPEPGRATS
jgi:hypothetical protein